MVVSRLQVAEGDVIPRWYGIAWHDHWKQRTVCYPIPLNVVMAVWHRVHGWLRFPVRGSMTKSERACFENGRRAGIWEAENLPPIGSRRGVN